VVITGSIRMGIIVVCVQTIQWGEFTTLKGIFFMTVECINMFLCNALFVLFPYKSSYSTFVDVWQ